MGQARAYLRLCSQLKEHSSQSAVVASRPVFSAVQRKPQSTVPGGSKFVTVKRTGRVKRVAVSHFGKRQLKLPGAPDHQKAEKPAEHSNPDATDKGGQQRRAAVQQDFLSFQKPVIQLQKQPIISHDGTRKELLETIQVYRVPALNVLAKRMSAEQFNTLQKAKQEGQQPQKSGQTQLNSQHQTAASKTSEQRTAASSGKKRRNKGRKQERRLVQLGNTLMPNGADTRRFNAAGVIVTSFGKPDGHLRVLMAQESNRKSTWYRNLVHKSARLQHPYGLLGGKRKTVDINPQATALRELSEETAGLLNKHTVKLSDTVVFLNQPGLYYIFFCVLEDQDDLPEKFAKRMAQPSANDQPCSTKSLAWVPLRELARWPRSAFFDQIMRSTAVPANLCLQQHEHDRKALLIKSELSTAPAAVTSKEMHAPQSTASAVVTSKQIHTPHMHRGTRRPTRPPNRAT